MAEFGMRASGIAALGHLVDTRDVTRFCMVMDRNATAPNSVAQIRGNMGPVRVAPNNVVLNLTRGKF
jgi:hypothetical protein